MTLRTFPGQFALRFPFRSPDEDAGFQGEAPLTAEFDERTDGPEPEQEPAAEIEADPHAEEEPVAEAEEEPAEAVAEPEGEDAAEPESEAARAPRKDWKQARIDKLTANAKASDERAKAAEDRAAALEALYGNQDGPDGSPAPKLYTQAEVDALADQKSRHRDLESRIDKLFDAGSEKYGKDWQPRLAQISGAFGQDLANRPDIFDAITKLPNGPDVYHALGGDLDHMAHILELSPVDLGMELAGLSAKLAKPKPPAVSKVPAPIRPLEKTQVDELPLDDPKVSMEEFNRRMDAEEEKRWAKTGRR